MSLNLTPEQVEKFWSLVDTSGGDGACWPWRGPQRPYGYGLFSAGARNRQFSAHRVAFELAFGPIPAGMNVCHACDHPPCTNPAHLFLGTQRDNMLDMVAKQRDACLRNPAGKPRGEQNGANASPERRPHGESHGNAKLTDDQIREIRAKYQGRKYGCNRLATEYGVAPSTINRILRKIGWAHIN